MRLAQYVLLGIGGVRALHALGIEPGVVHLNEGHAAFAGARARARRDASERRLGRGRARGRPRAHGLHHPHAGPGGQRHLPGRRRSPSARRARGRARASTPTTLVRRGRTHPDEAAEPFGVTQFALRSSRAANGVSAPPRRGRARDVAAACGRTARSTTCRSGTSPTACTSRPGSARPMRELLDRHLGEGWMDRAIDPATWDGRRRASPTRSCGPRAARSARELIELVRERSVTDRLGRGDTPEYVRAAADGARPRRADDRLRAPRRDLQAARPAAQRDVDRALALLGDERPAGAAAPRRQGAPARRRRQAARAAAVRDEGAARRSAAASSTSTTTTSRSARR